MVTLQLRQLDVPPGQRLVVRDLPWAELELILTEMGEHRATRIAYNDEVLEITRFEKYCCSYNNYDFKGCKTFFTHSVFGLDNNGSGTD
jgi:hypothetical protein